MTGSSPGATCVSPATEDAARRFAASTARAYLRSRALVLMRVPSPGLPRATGVGEVGALAADGVHVARVRDRAPQVHLAEALGVVLRDEPERLVEERHRLCARTLPLSPLGGLQQEVH